VVRDVRVRKPDEEGPHLGASFLMAAFVVRRILWAIPVLFLAVTMIFFLMRAIGGNPFRHGPLLGLAGPGERWVKYGDPQPEAIEDNLARRYGLDLPWYEQYVNFLEGVVTFDFGPSLSFRNQTVNALIAETAPSSLELGILALAWAILLGVPAGVFAALRPNTALDYCVRLSSSIGFAVPNFLVATMLVYLVSVKLGWLPTNGWTSWRHKLLPSLTLALLPMAYLTRIVRGSMLETFQEDYVRAARAKGLRYGHVVVGHALRKLAHPGGNRGSAAARLPGDRRLRDRDDLLGPRAQPLLHLRRGGARLHVRARSHGAHHYGDRRSQPRGRHRLRAARSAHSGVLSSEQTATRTRRRSS
jgi:oligopeptide transport system permease protein